MGDFRSGFFSFVESARRAFSIWKRYSKPQECLTVSRRMAIVWQKLKIREDEGLGKKSFVGAEQKYTCKKRHIKQSANAVHMFTVENVADKTFGC